MYYVHCVNYRTLISEFIYDSEDYNDPDYEVSINSEDSDNTSNNESNIVSQSFFNKSEKSNTSKSSLLIPQSIIMKELKRVMTQILSYLNLKRKEQKIFFQVL